MINLNLIFNKVYYSKISTVNFGDLDDKEVKKREDAVAELKEDIELRNTQICSVRFDHDGKDYRGLSTEVAPQQFLMETVYPGLIIGSGNPHCAQLCSNDINNGFSFDYVSGQPYIPGSSVKGVLRSCFRDFPDAVSEILSKILKDKNKFSDLSQIEKEIFDGTDIFFDAVIYDGDQNRRILDTDYITPHPDETKNPIPILVLKLLPDVCLNFSFRLFNGILTIDEKCELFKTLLSVFGIGAKTNTGYGRLVYTESRDLTNKSAEDTIICEDCNRVYKLNDFEKDKIKNEGWRITRCRDCNNKRKQQKNGGNWNGKSNRT